MAIDADDRDERQVRVDWMIKEFQDAQRRRLVKGADRTVASPTETDTTPAPTGPATSK